MITQQSTEVSGELGAAHPGSDGTAGRHQYRRSAALIAVGEGPSARVVAFTVLLGSGR
jgi:hypothetical protein